MQQILSKTNILEKEFEFSLEKISRQQLENLFLFTINHNTAPVAIREKFSIPEYNLKNTFEKFKNYKSLKAFIVISTCNRTEIYFETTNTKNPLEEIIDFYKNHIELEPKLIKEYGSLFNGEEVINHAFKLTSGLDSLVIGERQILSQVKTSYSLAQKEKTLSSTLELLFQNAIKAAKEVHKTTDISKNSQSISSVAIDLADKIAGTLKTKSVMVLGAGKMAKLSLEHILRIGGTKETLVLNKSPHRVIEFSDKYKVTKTFPFEDVYNVLNDTDILICAAGAPHFILFAEQFNKLRKDSKKSLYIFDISMPRNIDSEFGKLDNVTLYDIDTIQRAGSRLEGDEAEIAKAKKIINEWITRFYRKLPNEEINLLIKDFEEKLETIRTNQLTKLLKNKEQFTKEELDYITKNILNTIFHRAKIKIKTSPSLFNSLENVKDLFEI